MQEEMSQQDRDDHDLLLYFSERWALMARFLYLFAWMVCVPLSILTLALYFLFGRDSPLLIVFSIITAGFFLFVLRRLHMIDQSTILLHNVEADFGFLHGYVVPDNAQVRLYGSVLDAASKQRLRADIVAGVRNLKQLDPRGFAAFEASLRDRQREEEYAESGDVAAPPPDTGRLGGF